MKRKLFLFAVMIVFAVSTYGCDTYKSVPPNYLGVKLTPTGFEDKIYGPGMVDIGDVGSGGKQTVLVLIQQSGVHIKEQFNGPESSADKEDHRLLTKDETPMTGDVRLLLALPNHNTTEGKKDFMRVMSLGNPKPTNDSRVMIINAEDIYAQQARLLVRSDIRMIHAQYDDFNGAFSAFGDRTEKGLNSQIKSSAVKILDEQNVPLRVVEAMVSNLKPDKRVAEASIQIKAADSQIKSIKIIGEFLRKNPDMREVYKYQVMKEISQIRSDNGHSTMLIDMNGNNSFLPIPVKGAKAALSAPETGQSVVTAKKEE